MQPNRIIGSIWFYGGVVVFLYLFFLIGEFWLNNGFIFNNATVSYLVYLLLAMGLIVVGRGLLNKNIWAKWLAYFLAIIIAALSLFFILMVGAEFGFHMEFFAILIFIFSLCSIVLIKKSFIGVQ